MSDIQFDLELVGKTFTSHTSFPEDPKNKDGLHIECNAYIKDCLIDMTIQKDTDESFSVTRNGNAVVEDTIIRGTGKLILIGSGDKDGIGVIEFNNCVFENGCRRFPEVQDGYVVVCNNCIIRNWGLKQFFDTRAFGSWVHTKGSKLVMNDCHFEQTSFFQLGGIWNILQDFGNQIGQAWKDEGIRGLFHISTWIPGVCRGAFATDGGEIELHRCTKNKWWIRLENNKR